MADAAARPDSKGEPPHFMQGGQFRIRVRFESEVPREAEIWLSYVGPEEARGTRMLFVSERRRDSTGGVAFSLIGQVPRDAPAGTYGVGAFEARFPGHPEWPPEPIPQAGLGLAVKIVIDEWSAGSPPPMPRLIPG